MRSFAVVSLLAYASAITVGNSGNPFQNTPNYYVNPNYQKELQSSIDTASGSTRDYLSKMKEISSAYWLDKKSVLTGTSTTSTMEGILKDAASRSTKQLVTLMVYDLPNRDCHVRYSVCKIILG